MNPHVPTNSEGTLMFKIPHKVNAEFSISRTLMNNYDLFSCATGQYQRHTTFEVARKLLDQDTNIVGASKPTPTSTFPRSNTNKESNNAFSAKDVKGQNGAGFRHQRKRYSKKRRKNMQVSSPMKGIESISPTAIATLIDPATLIASSTPTTLTPRESTQEVGPAHTRNGISSVINPNNGPYRSLDDDDIFRPPLITKLGGQWKGKSEKR
ncbi:hypothetical protein EC957_001997 [Mortierella hygrophila]|uniref:Uncharacterized protein n=1 Tax=Mortierella hygrophila TaxID=979708 RepID=A0A9P6FG95_9FUNG|nr:hypothetical protein EC957_001997 [Mortierella hygrophila]